MLAAVATQSGVSAESALSIVELSFVFFGFSYFLSSLLLPVLHNSFSATFVLNVLQAFNWSKPCSARIRIVVFQVTGPSDQVSMAA